MKGAVRKWPAPVKNSTKLLNLVLIFLLRRGLIAADLLPAGCLLLALMHVSGVLAVVGNGRNCERDDAEAKQQDEDSTGFAGQKAHRRVVLIEDGQRDEHTGKDDGQMRKRTAESSHTITSSN